MASRRLSRLGLPQNVVQRLSARSLLTAGDVLFRTDLEVMQLSDLPLSEVQSTRVHISRIICPPTCTVLDIVQAAGAEVRIPTQLPALDDALGGGLPCGSISELVGPSGVGKSQMCVMLAILATLPSSIGGLDGRVVLFDAERKFTSQRLLEVAQLRFPNFCSRNADQLKLVERVLLITPASAGDFLARLRSLHGVIVRDGVRLILLDSVAALVHSEVGWQSLRKRQEYVGQLALLLKELAEGYGVPVVVTNQVSSSASDSFRSVPWSMGKASGGGGQDGMGTKEDPEQQLALNLERQMGFGGFDQAPFQNDQVRNQEFQNGAGGQGNKFQNGSDGQGNKRWIAALGVKWAHAVNVRLAFDFVSASGVRMVSIAKAPMVPPFLTQYVVSRRGLEEISSEEDPSEMQHGGM